MSEPILVRLFPEYGNAFPVWGVDRDDIDLPADLIERLLEWQQVWERHVRAGDPVTDADREALEWVTSQARPLRLAMQAALGDDFRVITVLGEEFFSDDDLPPLPIMELSSSDGPYWWEKLTIAQHNARGSFHFPPPTVSEEQVLDFWLSVPIPDEVLIAVQEGLRQHYQSAATTGTHSVRDELMVRWLEAHPEPALEAARMEWLSDRNQAEVEAGRVAQRGIGRSIPWCEDLRSLVRAHSMMQATTDLMNLGADEDAGARLLEVPLPWGKRAATVAEIMSSFPMADWWIPAPGQSHPKAMFDESTGSILVGGPPAG